MCYDIQAKLQSQLKRARANGDHASITELTEKLEKFLGKPLFHASGFSHPSLLMYPNTDKFVPVVATWGFIPEWVRTPQQAKELWNSTLNARGETIFEKPSFRESAHHKRCIVPIDGFFEHHHFQSKTYPYFIQRKDQEPMNLAGLYSDWVNPETGELVRTFSFVTKRGNALMGAIHNNPKLSEPRMPVMLDDRQTEDWLDAKTEHGVQEIIQQECTLELAAHPVQRLRGKAYLGNTESISEEVEYPELKIVIP
jgi:putative SOS response-associated peptidase YedK